MAAPTIARWQDQPASKSQQRYIPALAARKGMHTVKNAKTGEMMPITAENVATMTKGYASKLYYALKGLSIVSQHTDSAIDWDTDGRDDNGYADSDSTSRWIERTERMYV